MGKRRDGREAAVQYLFQRDLHSGETPEDPADFWRLSEVNDKRVREFAGQLIAGVLANLSDIDGRIRKFSANFDFERIAAVDRNVMRVAVYEMLHNQEIPPVVAINEAIEVAKKFGGEDSRKFVNGILDSVRKELPRQAREFIPRPKPGYPQTARGSVKTAGQLQRQPEA